MASKERLAEGLERVKEWPAETRDEGIRLFDSGMTKREVASGSASASRP
jgi:hypothetical protein